MTAYSLSFASLLMAGAALGDRFGRRSMFVFGLLAFALASAGCAAATSIGWLIFARALQGAASVAGLLITTEAMVAELPKKEAAMPAMPHGEI